MRSITRLRVRTENDLLMPPPIDMDGKVAVITGASDGIGAAAALVLHGLGATVAVVGRSREKTAKVAALVDSEPLVADFSRLDSVRGLADELRRRYARIDVLANNAGGTWPRRQITEDGHELTFQVNHLAPFLLTGLLHDRLAAAHGRVVVTSSAGHRVGHVRLDDLDSSRWYLGLRAYGTSKLENILFAAELARRGADDGVSAVSFHPGLVATSLGRDSRALRVVYGARAQHLRTPEHGADTLLWLATAPTTEWDNGGYYVDRKAVKVRGQAANRPLAAALWERSAEMVGT
jgi:NAD(P)-dependent dehydrogenase (short-subunit alcohol dehydrogenase family)